MGFMLVNLVMEKCIKKHNFGNNMKEKCRLKLTNEIPFESCECQDEFCSILEQSRSQNS